MLIQNPLSEFKNHASFPRSSAFNAKSYNLSRRSHNYPMITALICTQTYKFEYKHTHTYIDTHTSISTANPINRYITSWATYFPEQCMTSFGYNERLKFKVAQKKPSLNNSFLRPVSILIQNPLTEFKNPAPLPRYSPFTAKA